MILFTGWLTPVLLRARFPAAGNPLGFSDFTAGGTEHHAALLTTRARRSWPYPDPSLPGQDTGASSLPSPAAAHL